MDVSTTAAKMREDPVLVEEDVVGRDSGAIMVLKLAPFGLCVFVECLYDNCEDRKR